MDKFEYYSYVYNTEGFMGGKVDVAHLNRELNCFGMDGWELVSSTTTSQGNGYSKSIVFIFKRKKG